MTKVHAMDLQVGDVKAETVRGMGQATVWRRRVDEDGVVWIYWVYGIEMHFLGNDANYWPERNPEFELVNR